MNNEIKELTLRVEKLERALETIRLRLGFAGEPEKYGPFPIEKEKKKYE